MEGYIYPPIYLILDMLSEDEMKGLHAKGDCYISLDRGEGFGLSTATAGAAGNPVIATGFGGATEYLKQDNSYLVDFVEVCCHGMPWSRWYILDQYWAQPSEKHASQLMKYVYENQAVAKVIGKKLQNSLDENLNWKVIGQKIIDGIQSL
jgi:glycosyltransferase involved in cell wall biosynthesis